MHDENIVFFIDEDGWTHITTDSQWSAAVRLEGRIYGGTGTIRSITVKRKPTVH